MNRLIVLQKYIWRLRIALNKLEVPMEAIISSIILGLVLVMLGVNVYGKVDQGRRDYEVYLSEVAALAELKSERDRLLEELAYTKSLEYKLLYVRDSFNLARPGERIYELPPEVKFFEVQEPPLRVYSELSIPKLWQILLFE
jgi:cell division protein FtsB